MPFILFLFFQYHGFLWGLFDIKQILWTFHSILNFFDILFKEIALSLWITLDIIDILKVDSSNQYTLFAFVLRN